MDVYFELSGEVFEWDERKALLNEREHKLTFKEAAFAFLDTNALQFPDDEHSERELRTMLIGFVANGQLARVSFTERLPNLRIISARYADNYDQSRYYSGY